MRTRTLGKTGITVGEIGLGTWSVSGEGYGRIPAGEAEATVRAALDAGVTFIDTADCYAKGATLRHVGAALRGRAPGEVVVCVRIGIDRGGYNPTRRFDAKYLTRAFEAAREALGVDVIDVVALHNPSEATLQKPEAMEALRALRERGKIRATGVSVATVEAGRAAIAAGAEVLMLPYNLFYQKVLHGLSADVSTAGCGVVVRTPLAYGLLADAWGASRRFDDGDHRSRRWLPTELARRVRQRERARALVHDGVASLRDAALRYVLSNGLVSTVIPGARSPEQARQNAQAAATLPYVPDGDMARIGTLLGEG